MNLNTAQFCGSIAALVLAAHASGAALGTDSGYRGIWYYNQPTKDEYRYKYSGGLATYPQQHIPLAIYSPEANKTFFVYGGTSARSADDQQNLWHMVSYFDHATGQLPKPRVLLDKKTDDAHDNPVLSLDDDGHLWIFSPSHGTGRPSFIHRSEQPHSIDSFELISTTNFSYPQPWWVPGKGFLFLHTRYLNPKTAGRGAIRVLHWMTSPDGRVWSDPQVLARLEMGDYQISWRRGGRVATAFDLHPKPVGLNARANIYYLETADFGKTWRTVFGEVVQTPLTNAVNTALVLDSRSNNDLVYLKDVNFDGRGNPVILFMISKGFEPGPDNGPRTWKTAHWIGGSWEFSSITTSGNNYDHGSLFIDENGTWRVIAPTERGPQPFNPGGEIAVWLSRDQGKIWIKDKQLTRNSSRNHTYVRRSVNAHPDFAAFWADGDARKPSESVLYFSNQGGDKGWKLPSDMPAEKGAPEAAW